MGKTHTKLTGWPGSIPADIVSQGDNFFVFHLLSKKDLVSLSNANAHYSRDIITQILNEPIRGKSYMRTSHQPFVIPIMVKNFEVSVQPNNSMAVQSVSTAMSDMLADIRNQENDLHARSVYEKFVIVDDDPSIAHDRKCPAVFRMLTDDERRYLDSINALQKRQDGTPFALTYQYQHKLRSMRPFGNYAEDQKFLHIVTCFLLANFRMSSLNLTVL